MPILILSFVVYEASFVVGSIRLDVEAGAISDSLLEFSDEERSIFMIHFAESMWSSSLHMGIFT